MPIVKDLLNGDNIGLKESKSSNRTGQIGATLTAYAGTSPTLAMMMMRTCSLMVNGPGLSGIPKKEILGK
jgi:hypothetical protein